VLASCIVSANLAKVRGKVRQNKALEAVVDVLFVRKYIIVSKSIFLIFTFGRASGSSQTTSKK
jgi:hypothetical protein